jgi:signal transduction histidine kinase
MAVRTKQSWWNRPEFRLIALFVLFSVGLYWVSGVFRAAIDSNGSVVAVAGRMRLDLVGTFRAIADLQSRDPAIAAAAGDELARASAAVERQLQVLREGGQTALGPNQTLQIGAGALPPAARGVADGLAESWAPIATAIANFTAAPGDPEQQVALAATARAAEAGLLRQAAGLIGMVGADSSGQARKLGITLLVAGALGVAFFLLLIWLYSKQLRAAAAARKETDEILATVKSGLFLLDRDFRIGSQHSTALTQILPYDELSGRSFVELMKPLIDPTTLRTLVDYLGLLFEERVKESLIESLNPLDRVQLNVSGDSGRSERRFLEFAFRRVAEAGAPSYLLVSANDVTDRVQLREELERTKEVLNLESERAVELVARLLRLDGAVVSGAVQRWGDLLHEANDSLRDAGSRGGDLRELIDRVFRPLHAVKGEAAGLGLDYFAQRVAAVERDLSDLRTRPALDGNDFLAVAVGLEDVFRQHATLAAMVEKLALASSVPAVARSAVPATASVGALAVGNAAPFAVLDAIVAEVGRELDRRAVLEHQGLDTAVPDELRRPILDLLVQLVRNALAHGIESEDRRAKLGKPPVGRLRAMFRGTADGGFELVFNDDGAGIDFDAVRARAIATSRMTAERAAAATDGELIRFLFEPGFTTRDAVSDEAGHGVGLDIVRAVATRIRAKINVGSAAGRGTSFRFTIPGGASA